MIPPCGKFFKALAEGNGICYNKIKIFNNTQTNCDDGEKTRKYSQRGT